LGNGAITQFRDSLAIRKKIGASIASDRVEDLINKWARELWRHVGDVVQVQESSSMHRRRDGKDSLHEIPNSTKLCDIQRLERTLEMSYQINLLSTSLALHIPHELCNFSRRLANGLEASDQREESVFAVRDAGGAETLALQVGSEYVDIFVVCRAETMEEDDRIPICLTATVEIVMVNSLGYTYGA
jgi:hypothetical protein